jgi:uncharacterized OsmC-like protein
MTRIDEALLRDRHEAVIAKLEADPTFGLMRPYVEASLVEDVSVESRFIQYDREFTFLSDEAAIRGGKETGPSPMRYFLSGIAFCSLGWWAKGAALQGVPLDSLSVTYRTFLDMRGEHGLDETSIAPQWLVAEVTTTGGADPAAVLSVIDWGLTYCPLASLVGRALPLHVKVTHDGAVIRDDIPEHAR